MKILLKLSIIFTLLFSIFYAQQVIAGVNTSSIPSTNITNVSISNPTWWIIGIWTSLLTTIKIALWWILLIFIVYTWAQMIMSMWSDEEELKTSKRQIRYSVVWLIFINIPSSLYNAFYPERRGDINESINNWEDWRTATNLFFSSAFEDTLNWKIILFIEVLISGVAIFMLTVAWVKIILARWRDEEVTKGKHKIIWSIIWLIFVWFIETWQSFIYSWRIEDWVNLFETIANLSLFFAWPIAIIYLSIAWYYYVTSNGDEEKVKKAKSIIVNTVIATVIVLASYTLLLDLSNL